MIVRPPNTTVTLEAMSGKMGRRRSTTSMATMAMTVEMINAQVPAAMPYMALTMNINTSGPNSLRMFTACSAVKGINRLSALMCRRLPFCLKFSC